jgi:PilZ domain
VAHPLSPSARLEFVQRVVKAMNTGAIMPGATKALTSGFRFSGDFPLDIGETCSLTVTSPNEQFVYVAAGIVRWVRGEEYGVKSLVMDSESREEMVGYIRERV